MNRADRGPNARVIAPALLVIGVVAATLLFLRSQPAGVPTPGGAGQVGVPAADPHAAAGVETGGASGDVAARFQRQVDALRAKVDAAPSDRRLVLELAQLLHDGHRIPDALPLYRRAIELDPSDPQPYYDLASAQGGLGDWEAAAAALEELLDRDAGNAVALYDLGAVRATQGRTADARRLLEEARETTSDGALRARISEALVRLKRQ